MSTAEGAVLIQENAVDYQREGRNTVKKAREPFRFVDQVHLKELTAIKAKNLKELVDILKNTPDSIVHYHTHHFLEERHYLTPEPANDFAVWANDVLGEEILGEKLASIDVLEFPTMNALRNRVVNVIEQHVLSEQEMREVPEGKEFYFIKWVSIVLATPHVARDLREFGEALGTLSPGSLYFHIIESRLRTGTLSNDFSVWLDSLGEQELAEAAARLDPYTYTLEGVRSQLIKLVAKRIK
jgi:hypothetical protein